MKYPWSSCTCSKGSILQGPSFPHLFSRLFDTLAFENALEVFFKCPSCGQVLNLKKNDKAKKAFAWKVDHIKKDMRK